MRAADAAVIWRPRARADVVEHYAYIARDKLEPADKPRAQRRRSGAPDSWGGTAQPDPLSPLRSFLPALRPRLVETRRLRGHGVIAKLYGMPNSSLRITLPESLRAWVQRQASRNGYSTPSEYIRTLLQLERLREVEDKVDARLLEALDSGPATPMTAEDWQDIRSERRKRVAMHRPDATVRRALPLQDRRAGG
jgi:antitoxin ParD1/3/4